MTGLRSTSKGERGTAPGRRAYCPTCDLVEHVDAKWRCLWCETATMTGPNTRPRACRFATILVVREAHRLHAEGLTVDEAAAATLEQTGYYHVHAWRSALQGAWALYGLPSRGRRNANILRYRREPCRNRFPNPPPNKRVSDEAVLAAYAATGTTVAAAKLVGIRQNATWERLKRLGALKSQQPA